MAGERTLIWKVGRVLFGAFFNLFFHMRFVDMHNLPPKGGGVVSPNHISSLDPVVIQLLVARRDRTLHFFSGTEFFARPVIGHGLRAFNQIPLKRGANDTVVMFICNHCPYVQAVFDRIVRDAADLQALGVGVVAISSNDATAYPEDSFDAMKRLWRARRLPFPYLYDAEQSVARAYEAVCTPDFYGYDRELKLQYHGRLDASGRQPAPAGARRELFEAMKSVVLSGRGPDQQARSIGCSIKWKAAT